MKLKRENLKKQKFGQITTYMYTCNDIDFFIQIDETDNNKKISVFKNSLDERQDNFDTDDTLTAWNKFEEYLEVCESEQKSSGGFAKNPQQNPNVIPLLAIKKIDTGAFSCVLFVQAETEQIIMFGFEVDSRSMPQPLPDKLFVVDWAQQEIPAIVKCEVIMKKIPIIFEEDTDCDVFLFIPKSMVEQGGEQGGNTESSEQGGEGEGYLGESSEFSEVEQEGEGEEGGEESDLGESSEFTEVDEEEGTEEGGEEGGQQGEQEKGEGAEESQETTSSQTNDMPDSDTRKRGTPSDTEPPQPIQYNFSQLISQISQITNTPPSILVNVFRNESLGETWLLANNFPRIKKELNLRDNMPAREFSQIIINSK